MFCCVHANGEHYVSLRPYRWPALCSAASILMASTMFRCVHTNGSMASTPYCVHIDGQYSGSLRPYVRQAHPLCPIVLLFPASSCVQHLAFSIQHSVVSNTQRSAAPIVPEHAAFRILQRTAMFYILRPGTSCDILS
jgi:hypothetical protein